MSIERFGLKLLEQRRHGNRVAPKAEQILQPELKFLVVRQQLRRRDPGNLVAQGPHGIKTQRLMPCRVGNHIGLRPIGARHIIIHDVEKQPGDKAAGGNRAARVTGHGRVVVHDGAKRPVNEIEGFAILQRGFIERVAFFRQAIGRINKDTAPRPKGHGAFFRGHPRRSP